MTNYTAISLPSLLRMLAFYVAEAAIVPAGLVEALGENGVHLTDVQFITEVTQC